MKSVFQIAILIAVASSAASITWLLRDTDTKLTPVPHCDPASLKPDEICFDQVSGNVLWVDARSRKEWQEDGYPNSILWNLDPKEDALKMEADAVMKIIDCEMVIIYCTSQACGTSRQVAALIRKLDLGPEVKILHGGYPALRLKDEGQ
jgi:rhodanese-related sulfurtransferase